MSNKRDNRLFEDIEHEIRGIVERHPDLDRMPEVAKRNMAYSAASAIESEWAYWQKRA